MKLKTELIYFTMSSKNKASAPPFSMLKYILSILKDSKHLISETNTI